MPGISRHTQLTLVGLLSLLWALLWAPLALGADGPLAIMLGSFAADDLIVDERLTAMRPLRLYVVGRSGSDHWVLKLGFFESRTTARSIAKSLRSRYPDLAIEPVAPREFDRVDAETRSTSAPASLPSVVVVPLGSRLDADRALARAGALYRGHHYQQAGQLYHLLANTAEHDQAAWALEVYGVCLEKSRRRDEALAVYRRWLGKYGQDQGAKRVNQRLQALLTAPLDPKAPRRATSAGRSPAQVYGSASMVYQTFRTRVDGSSSDTTLSALDTSIDLHLRTEAGGFLFEGRIDGGYLQDFSSGSQSDRRASNLYLRLRHQASGTELIIGRQRSNDHGVYGYFDGVSLAVPTGSLVTLTGATGFMANSSFSGLDTDHRFYALGAELRPPGSGLDLRIYGIEQRYHSLTERRAVGGELSWFNTWSQYLVIADYDIKFKKANNLLVNANWQLGGRTNFAFSLGYQRSPFLSASNALLGEQETDLQKYVATLNSSGDIYQSALDKTAVSKYGSLVLTQALTDDVRLIGEIYRYELTDIPSFDPTITARGSDTTTTYGLQTVLSNLLLDGDALSLGARYSTGDTVDTASLFADERLRLGRRLSLTLRLLASRRWLQPSGRNAYSLRPGLRLQWYITASTLVEAESGYERSRQDFAGGTLDASQMFCIIGIRTRF